MEYNDSSTIGGFIKYRHTFQTFGTGRQSGGGAPESGLVTVGNASGQSKLARIYVGYGIVSDFSYDEEERRRSYARYAEIMLGNVLLMYGEILPAVAKWHFTLVFGYSSRNASQLRDLVLGHKL